MVSKFKFQQVLGRARLKQWTIRLGLLFACANLTNGFPTWGGFTFSSWAQLSSWYNSSSSVLPDGFVLLGPLNIAGPRTGDKWDDYVFAQKLLLVLEDPVPGWFDPNTTPIAIYLAAGPGDQPLSPPPGWTPDQRYLVLWTDRTTFFKMLARGAGPLDGEVIQKATSANGVAINAAISGVVSEATGNLEGGPSTAEVDEFRLANSPQRIKLGMGSMTGAFAERRPTQHTRTLAALEKALGAAKAMKQISNDVTVWASGVYSQGQMKPMFTNPAAREKHYGVMMGSHTFHKPTKQMIGVAVDLGLGGSIVNTNHDMKNSYQSKQVTVYYGKGFAQDWNLSIHGSFMCIDSSHHRPYTAANGSKGIAVSHGKAHVMSGLVEVSRKFKPSDVVHIKSSFGGIYGRTKQFAYKEYDAGANNQSFAATTMNEAGLKAGVKVSLFKKSSEHEHKTWGLYPYINYTRYVKMGSVKQRITTLNTGQTQVIQSGTAGKNLLSVGMGAGVTDSEANTKTQLAYTANFQKYRKSHELMLKYSTEF